jgi:hypothetical protein
MTQVFASDDQVAGTGMLTRGGPIPIQGRPEYHQLRVLGPAMTAGKGVRPISCVGCSRDTLPRHDDGAPLCERCSELLASTLPGSLDSRAAAGADRTPRWFRRRSSVD